MKKIIILLISLVGTGMLYVLFHSRETGLCSIDCGDWVNKSQNTFLFFPLLLFFSLVTFKMPSSVFIAWWKFARIATPAILIVSTLINLQLHHDSGGFMNMDDMFDIPALLLMYAVFVLGSIVQIWRGYRSKK